MQPKSRPGASCPSCADTAARVSVEGIGGMAKRMRAGAAGAALVAALCAAAPAHAAVEGALTELSGAGSCLSENVDSTEDCTPLAGLPGPPTAAGDMGVPAFTSDGRNAYLGTELPDREFDEGPAMLYALRRDPASGRLTQLTGRGSCFAEDGRAPCERLRGVDAFARAMVTQDGRFVYAGSGNGFAVLRRDPATGLLEQLSGRAGCLNRLGSGGCTRVRGMTVERMTLTPGDRQVVANSGPTLYVLQRDRRTGTLHCSGTPGGCLSSGSKSRCRHIPGIDELPVYTRDGRYAYAPSGDRD